MEREEIKPDSRFKTWIKAIALILIIAFIWQDIVWAYPDISEMKKSVLIGAVIGIGTGIAIALLGILNQGANEPLQSTVNFFGSVPTYFIMAYNLSTPTGIIVFFAYWAIIGAIFGLLVELPIKTRYILIAIFIIFFIVAHRLAQVAMGREMQAIMDSLGRILKHAFMVKGMP